jgi:hypothetical protein
VWTLQKILSLVKTTPSSVTITAAWYAVWPGMWTSRKVWSPTRSFISLSKVMTGALGV